MNNKIHLDAVNITWNGGAGHNESRREANKNHTCEKHKVRNTETN